MSSYQESATGRLKFMRCKVEKSHISGEIVCPPSKSYTHRAIFIASLAGNSKVENVLFSADTEATICACKSFGAELIADNRSITVKKPISLDSIVPEIDAANSGTTIRIAAGIAALFSHKITLTGDQSLQSRPMQPLLAALEDMGAECHSRNGMPPLTIMGKIRGGAVAIPGNLSSQFISSLLICAPMTEDGIRISIKGESVSKPYIKATIHTMGKFGVPVKILSAYEKYDIKPKAYVPGTFYVPMDFSSLALLLSAAVLNGRNVSIVGSMGDLPQGDEVFIAMLDRLGVSVGMDGRKITVRTPERLLGGKFDLCDSPDLLPALAILALKASETIEIFNVKHARIKETDRIAILHRELKKLGLKIQEREDGLVIEPPENLHGAELDPEQDHRLFMAFCISGMFVGGCTIRDQESVTVSYPSFVEDMVVAGAKISAI